MWKLYRKSPVDFRPIFHKLTKQFPDLDLYLPREPDGSLPPGPAAAAANDMGVNQNQNMADQIKAMQEYFTKQLGQSQQALADALDQLRRQGGASVQQPPIIINNPAPPVEMPTPKPAEDEEEEGEEEDEEIQVKPGTITIVAATPETVASKRPSKHQQPDVFKKMVDAHKNGLIWYIPPGGSYADGRGLKPSSAPATKSRDLAKWREEQKTKEDAEKLPDVEAELEDLKKKYKNTKAREMYAKGKAACEKQGGKWDGANRACILPRSSPLEDDKVIQFPDIGKGEEQVDLNSIEQFVGVLQGIAAMGESKSLQTIKQLIKGI